MNKEMRLVIVESPYAGDIEANVKYARAAVRDSLSRGEAPIASHLLYTQPGILCDEKPDERQWGIDAGLAWRYVSDATVVYINRGISSGMEYGITKAIEAGKPVEFRSLGVNSGVCHGCDGYDPELSDDGFCDVCAEGVIDYQAECYRQFNQTNAQT